MAEPLSSSERSYSHAEALERLREGVLAVLDRSSSIEDAAREIVRFCDAENFGNVRSDFTVRLDALRRALDTRV